MFHQFKPTDEAPEGLLMNGNGDFGSLTSWFTQHEDKAKTNCCNSDSCDLEL